MTRETSEDYQNNYKTVINFEQTTKRLSDEDG